MPPSAPPASLAGSRLRGHRPARGDRLACRKQYGGVGRGTGALLTDNALRDRIAANATRYLFSERVLARTAGRWLEALDELSAGFGPPLRRAAVRAGAWRRGRCRRQELRRSNRTGRAVELGPTDWPLEEARRQRMTDIDPFRAEVERYLSPYAGDFNYEVMLQGHLDVSRFVEWVRQVGEYHPVDGSVVLSSGCGSAGDLLAFMQAGASRAYGVEVDPALAGLARMRFADTPFASAVQIGLLRWRRPAV